MAQDKHEAVAKASIGSVFLMSNPLAAMVSHKVYISVMTVMTLVLIGIFSRDYNSVRANMAVSSQRLTSA